MNTRTNRRRAGGVAFGVIALWLLFVLFDIAVVIGIAIVAIHFIRKWW